MTLVQIEQQFASLRDTPDEDLSSVHLALKTLMLERAELERLLARAHAPVGETLSERVARAIERVGSLPALR